MKELKINVNIEETIASYVEAACKYGELIESGNYEYASKNFAVNQKAFEKLFILGKPGCKALINLLDHKNSYVRMSASIHLLSSRINESLVVLKEIVCDAGFQGFNARLVLDDYKQSNIAVLPSISRTLGIA
jgi:hypothetical protein